MMTTSAKPQGRLDSLEDIRIPANSEPLPPVSHARQQVARLIAAMAAADGGAETVPSDVYAVAYLVSRRMNWPDGPYLARWRRSLALLPLTQVEPDGTFTSTSRTTGEVHTGRLSPAPDCSCADFRHSGGDVDCKHLLAAWHLRQRQSLAHWLTKNR